jgi:DNA-binding transcriptional regulator YhcF (GntR family)
VKPEVWPQAVSAVRGMIADGTLKPGDPAPTAGELARETGLHPAACAAALRTLAADGTLERVAATRRLRVAQPGAAPSPRDEELGRALARLREARGLTRRHLAVLLGVKLTVAEQAEAGRGRQDRGFWQRADGMLGAEGALLYEYDTRTAVTPEWGDSAQVRGGGR